MLMAARSSGGSPQWTRRPLPSARARHVVRVAGPLAAIAGFMAPSRSSGARKAAESDRVCDSGSDADEEEADSSNQAIDADEWEDLGREEGAAEEEEEDEELVAFRDAHFHDDDDDDVSEYAPSDTEVDSNTATEAESTAELDEEDESVAGLFAKYLPRRRRSSSKLGIARSLVLPPRGKASSDSDDSCFTEQDARFWSSAQEKRQWIGRYRAADRAYQRSFGCSIDSQALPEAKRQLQRERRLRPAFMAVLLALIAAYTAQLAGFPSAEVSSVPVVFSMVAMRSQEGFTGLFGGHVAVPEVPLTLEGDETHEGSPVADKVERTTVYDGDSIASRAENDASSGERPPSDYTKAAIDLCGHLLHRVVASHHDQKVAQNAASACDIAVRLASYGSLDGAIAHAQRGDLRSLLAEFQAADADYAVAALGLLSAASSSLGGGEGAALAMLQSAVDVKAVANRWVQLYMARNTDAFVQEIRHAAVSNEDATAAIVRRLAADWIGVLKREKTVVEALTALRMWTLRRLSDLAPPLTESSGVLNDHAH